MTWVVPALSTTLINWTVEIGCASDGFLGLWDNCGHMDVTYALFEPLADPSRLMSVNWHGQDFSLFSITEEVSRAWRDFPTECLIWNSTLGQGVTPAGKHPVHTAPQLSCCHWPCLQTRIQELLGV